MASQRNETNDIALHIDKYQRIFFCIIILRFACVSNSNVYRLLFEFLALRYF